ncbi:hypothetical protein CIK65_10710 [Brevibacterium aurantiacum]|uniref:Uncharacterized protein n=1 Tax=Brevibacterium aurantiacum TaxID=273384 RepID=A0A2A3YTT0_BREAU|nr:hypothetical protein CIK65_10710 [Brevibacterium aurantiacum]
MIVFEETRQRHRNGDRGKRDALLSDYGNADSSDVRPPLRMVERIPALTREANFFEHLGAVKVLLPRLRIEHRAHIGLVHDGQQGPATRCGVEHRTSAELEERPDRIGSIDPGDDHMLESIEHEQVHRLSYDVAHGVHLPHGQLREIARRGGAETDDERAIRQ